MCFSKQHPTISTSRNQPRSRRWHLARFASKGRTASICCAELKHNTQPVKALKEWSITISAILEGNQQVLLRRGGIREGAFKCGDEKFILFPTGYHTDPELCKPGTAIPYEANLDWDPKYADTIPLYGMAQADDIFTTMDADVFNLLDELHIWTDSFYEKRLGSRELQPITAILLRTWRFVDPVILHQSDSYWGCFSWLDMESTLFNDSMLTGQLVQPAVSPTAAARIFNQAKSACSELSS